VKIRNFCIIAHIDHGKSTLADRLLQTTGTVADREMKAQHLDQMDLERERGITIKLQPVRMAWTQDGTEYQLNLIDTPGHIDFAYEVSRSLQAVEGALLVVDASQGIQAQTLSVLYQAIDQDLAIIPVVNKIDLPAAEPDRVADEVAHLIGIDPSEVIRASGKTGEGVQEILRAVVERIPAPAEPVDENLRALIFDSAYDTFRGVVTYVRIVSGTLPSGSPITFMATRAEARAEEVGNLAPDFHKQAQLGAGEIGYIVTGVKSVAEARVGDTITTKQAAAPEPLPGYKEPQPMIFAGVFPVDPDDYPALRDSLGKLQLSDASLQFEPESSTALGFGFRLGLLGLLHLEIVRERLEREYDLDLLTTTPSVGYEVVTTSGETAKVSRAGELPDPTQIREIREPWVRLEIVTPPEHLGPIIELVQQRRGENQHIEYLEETRVLLHYDLPLAELVGDFYDRLKKISSGYASLSYDPLELRAGNLVKLEFLIAEERVEPLAIIVPKGAAEAIGRVVLLKLKEVIPKQQFPVALQAAVGGKILARETIGSLGKNVTAKLYGGDVTRKRKLLEKQKKGKKRLKQIGSVELPQEAFQALLQR
jgi:GTP-binding protein LepA